MGNELWPAADAERDEAAYGWLCEHDLAPDAGTPVGIDVDSLLLGSLLVDGEIARRATDAGLNAADLMRRVTEHKRDELFGAVEGGPFNPAAVLGRFAESWNDEQRTVFLIELLSAAPFAPYDVKTHSSSRVRNSRAAVAEAAGAGQLVDDVTSALAAAQAVHRTSTVARIGVLGLGTAVAVGAAGFLAAPAIGAALGANAGLQGAAASSYGLALLGGGSVAAGGMGMTGGVWLITGGAAAAGGVLGASSSAAYALGAAEYRHELVKLQATHRLVLATQQRHLAIANEVTNRLAADAVDLRSQLDVERQLNTANSGRVRDLAAKLHAVEQAIAFTAAP